MNYKHTLSWITQTKTSNGKIKKEFSVTSLVLETIYTTNNKTRPKN